jgi:hypothetical protein
MNDVRPVADVVADLVRDAEATLDRLVRLRPPVRTPPPATP